MTTHLQDPLDSIMAFAGDDPDLLRAIGRYAGVQFATETDDYRQAVALSDNEVQGNIASIGHAMGRGLTAAD